jgi:hypothetical protein
VLTGISTSCVVVVRVLMIGLVVSTLCHPCLANTPFVRSVVAANPAGDTPC